MTVAGPGWIPASQLTTLPYPPAQNGGASLPCSDHVCKSLTSEAKCGQYAGQICVGRNKICCIFKMSHFCGSSSMSILVISNNIPSVLGDSRSIFVVFLCCFNHPDLVWCHSFLLYCLHQAVICSDSLLPMFVYVRYFNLQKITPTSSAPSTTEPQEFGALVARMPATSRSRRFFGRRWSATSIALDYDGSTRCVTGHFKEITLW